MNTIKYCECQTPYPILAHLIDGSIIVTMRARYYVEEPPEQWDLLQTYLKKFSQKYDKLFICFRCGREIKYKEINEKLRYQMIDL